jgi:acetoin utilization protein AcuB
MTVCPVTIGTDQTLAVAHRKMRDNGIRHLPVLDGGELVGVVSIRDLHFLETLASVDPEQVFVEEAMTPDPYTVSPEAPLGDVAREMADHKYGCAIVVREGKVMGVFTTVDALRVLSRMLELGGAR